MVHTTSQLEHLQPIKLKILKIYQPPGNNNNNNSEKTKTKTSSPILSSSPLAAAKTTPSSSSSGVATSLVSSPAASSTKNKQFLIPPPNSLIAEVDAKSVKRNIFYQKTTNQQQLPISQPAYNNHHRKNAPHLQSSSFLVSPKSSTYSSEREPDGASAEDLPYRNETSSNRSTTNSKSSKQRSEAIIKARGAGAGIDSYEEIQLKNQNSVKKEASTAQRRLNLENNSRNSNLDGQAAKPSQKQQQQHENVLLKVERISDGKSGNLLLYGEALQDCSQLIGEDKCYVFNNLLQYHSSRKSQANNIQFMMAYPLRTSIVEIKNNSNSNSNSNDNRPAANAKTSEQKQKTEDLSSSHPTASSNNSNAGNQLSSSSRKNNKNNTRKFEDVVSSSHATTITQHHHHHHHWLVQQKTTTAQHKKQHRSSQHQHNALERQKMERKAEKITEHSLELARNTSTDAIENQQKRSSVKKSNNKHSHRTHHSIFYYSKPISPPSESPNLSSTKVSSPNSKTIQNHHSLRFHHSSSKPNSNSSSSRSKQPSASAALAKTMENESYSRSSSSIKKQSNSAYMTKIAIKNSSLGNSSVNTSTPTSETGSSNFSSSNNNNIMLNRDNVYQKPPVIPSNLLQNTFFKN